MWSDNGSDFLHNYLIFLEVPWDKSFWDIYKFWIYTVGKNYNKEYPGKIWES